jgi:IclR family acetate operon transcriptional repressor
MPVKSAPRSAPTRGSREPRGSKRADLTDRPSIISDGLEHEGAGAITGPDTQPNLVQSVERAFVLLESLADLGEVGVTDLSRATGLSYGTIHRLLGTLLEHGYARQNTVNRKYALGPRLMRLGDAASRTFGVWVRPYLSELMEISGETANLAVLEGDWAVYVAQVASSKHHVRMFTEVGRRVLPHTTAVGKVLLAFRPRAEVEALLDRTGLPPRTPRTITDRGRFLAGLDTVARHGYAVDDGEEEIGVRCLAVPVFGVGDAVAAASISAPEGRLSKEDYDRLLPEMLRISAALSGSLVAAP